MNRWQCISMEGVDAQDFLQRVTTAWAKKMQAGQAAKALLLTGTAKVIAPFFLLCVSQNDFFLLVEEILAQALFDGLEALHFAEKFTMQKRPGEARLYKKNSAQKNIAGAETFLIPFPTENSFLCWGKVDDSFELLTEEEFLEARIENKIPAYKKEYTEESNALDVGLLPWVQRGKGCYPGQEVVERSLNVGHPARALVQLTSIAPWVDGDELFIEGKKVGNLSSVFAQKALGIVQWRYKDPHTKFQIVRSGNTIGEAECLK